MALKINPMGPVSFTFNRSRFHADLSKEIRRLDRLSRNHLDWVEMVTEDLASELLRLAQWYCPTAKGALQLSGKIVKAKTAAGHPRFQVIFSTPYAGIVHDFWLPPLGGYPWAAEVGKYGKNTNPRARQFFLESAAEELAPRFHREIRKAVDYAQRNSR